MFEDETQLANSKLLILYIINLGEGSFKRSNLADFLLRGDYLNYFLIFQYLDELFNSKLIDKTGSDYFFLTQEGIETLGIFKSRLDENLLKRIDEDFSTYDFKKTGLISSKAKVKVNDESADVKLILVRDGKCIFNLEFSTEKSKALYFSKIWEEDYKILYEKFMNILN